MSRISERLASLHLTIWNLVVLLLWLGWGMLMANSDSYTEGFRGMNDVLVREWLISQQTDFFILKIWFIGICLLMTLLGINLIFCSWEKIFKIIRVRFNGPKFFMLIVHAIFGLVALCHLGGLMLGYEHNDIQLGEGKRYSFEDGYEVEIKGVTYTSDYMTLVTSSRYITKDQFDYRKNFAEVVLSRNGREVSGGDIYLLSPMIYKDIQVTLRAFIASPEKDNRKEVVNLNPWVTLTVSRNPVLKIFLVLYPMMIAGIFIYLLLTWRSAARDSIT